MMWILRCKFTCLRLSRISEVVWILWETSACQHRITFISSVTFVLQNIIVNSSSLVHINFIEDLQSLISKSSSLWKPYMKRCHITCRFELEIGTGITESSNSTLDHWGLIRNKRTSCTLWKVKEWYTNFLKTSTLITFQQTWHHLMEFLVLHGRQLKCSK